MHDRLGEDVRIPQPVGLRRGTQTLAVTGTSSTHELRDPDSADTEVWVTFFHSIQDPVYFCGGPHDSVYSGGADLADATTADWILPPDTERNYKLGRGETAVSIIVGGGGSGDVLAYLSSD